MHLQRTVPGWTKGLIPGLRQMVKAIDAGDILREAKGINALALTLIFCCVVPTIGVGVLFVLSLLSDRAKKTNEPD